MINYMIIQPLKCYLIQPFIISLTLSPIDLLLILSIPATQVSVLSLEYARWVPAYDLYTYSLIYLE